MSNKKFMGLIKTSLAKSMRGLVFSLGLLSACASGQQITKNDIKITSQESVVSLENMEDINVRNMIRKKLDGFIIIIKKYENIDDYKKSAEYIKRYSKLRENNSEVLFPDDSIIRNLLTDIGGELEYIDLELLLLSKEYKVNFDKIIKDLSVVRKNVRNELNVVKKRIDEKYSE